MNWLAVVLALLLPLPSLGGGMIADDDHFRMLARGTPGVPELTQSPVDAFNFTGMDARDRAVRKARGLTVWWTPEDMQIAFWRPLAAFTHWFDNAVWGEHPWLMHLQNIAWYGVLAGIVAWLYRRMAMTAPVAALAGLLYALDDAHAFPAAWIAGRNALLSGLFGVLCLLAHDTWRRERRWWAGGAAPLLLALGLMCGEAAAGAGGFLLAYAVFLDHGQRWGRLASLLPYAGIAVAWRVLYKWMGYGVAASSLYLEPFEQPVAYVENVLSSIPLMLSGQFAFPDPTIWLVLGTPGRFLLLGWAWAVAGAVLWLLWPGLKREPALRFWLAGTVVAMAPACATWPQNRLMLLPGVGAIALLTHAIVLGMRRGSDDTTDRGGAWGRRIASGLFVLNAFLAPAAFVATSAAIGLPSAYMTRLDDSMTETQELEQTDVVIVSAPMDVFAVNIPVSRSSQRRLVPRSVLLLRGGLGSADIYRVDGNSVIVTTPDGLVERPWSMLFRNVDTHPFAVGETVRLSNVEICVLSVSLAGNPIETRFRFRESLEQSGEWRIWRGTAFETFPLPEVGQSFHVAEESLIGLTRAVLEGSLGTGE